MSRTEKSTDPLEKLEALIQLLKRHRVLKYEGDNGTSIEFSHWAFRQEMQQAMRARAEEDAREAGSASSDDAPTV